MDSVSNCVFRGEEPSLSKFFVYAETKKNLKRFTKAQERRSFSVMTFTFSTQTSIDTAASS